MKLAIVFSEFGPQAVSTLQYQRVWPEAAVHVCRDGDVADPFTEPGRARHPRLGWRMHDYWQARQLLNVDADVAIAFDNDMRIVSPKAALLPQLARRFGLCLPANPRQLVAVDTAIGADSDGDPGEFEGLTYSVNTTPIALDRKNPVARRVVEEFCRIMLQRPTRAPLAWSRAFEKWGFNPCILPPQWCVCEANIGCGNELILHEGHSAVKCHYAEVVGQ